MKETKKVEDNSKEIINNAGAGFKGLPVEAVAANREYFDSVIEKIKKRQEEEE